MSSLIPVIEIGRQYLWRQAACELSCKKCGWTFGEGSNGKKVIVTILQDMKGLLGYCPKCYYSLVLPEGFYKTNLVAKDGMFFDVPYTQLSRLPDEHYE